MTTTTTGDQRADEQYVSHLTAAALRLDNGDIQGAIVCALLDIANSFQTIAEGMNAETADVIGLALSSIAENTASMYVEPDTLP